MNEAAFAENLRSLRIEAEKTQAEVAKDIGVCINYYGLLENRKRTPSEKVLKSISEYFKVPVQSLTSTAVKAANSPKTEINPTLPKEITPPADKGFLYRMSDGYLCAAAKCVWRQRVDANTYYCPPGCMKERSERIAK